VYHVPMLFLIDGYNVTMRAGSGQPGSKESQRDALVRTLNTRGKRLLGSGDIVCVFDARESLGRSSERIGSVRVAFAPDADTEIVRRASAHKGQVTVVTDDLRLRARLSQDVGRHVRFRDTAVLDAAVDVPAEAPKRGLFGRAGGKGRRGAGARQSDADRLSSKDAAAITAELEREWLDDAGQ